MLCGVPSRELRSLWRALWAWGAGTQAQTTLSGPVRIAVFGPMTGLYAATGKQIWTGAKQCG